MTDDNYIGIQASDDPKDLPVSAWQRVQWLHMQGDEVGLLSFVQRLYRDAFLNGHISSDQAAGWLSPEGVKAREAAARREALLEAAEELDVQPSYRVSGLFGHERDYADGKDSEAERIADWLRALAEPERDEESGR